MASAAVEWIVVGVHALVLTYRHPIGARGGAPAVYADRFVGGAGVVASPAVIRIGLGIEAIVVAQGFGGDASQYAFAVDTVLVVHAVFFACTAVVPIS